MKTLELTQEQADKYMSAEDDEVYDDVSSKIDQMLADCCNVLDASSDPTETASFVIKITK